MDQVVAMSTLNPAKALGVDDRLGSLEVGKQADISVLGRNGRRLACLRRSGPNPEGRQGSGPGAHRQEGPDCSRPAGAPAPGAGNPTALKLPRPRYRFLVGFSFLDQPPQFCQRPEPGPYVLGDERGHLRTARHQRSPPVSQVFHAWPLFRPSRASAIPGGAIVLPSPAWSSPFPGPPLPPVLPPACPTCGTLR